MFLDTLSSTIRMMSEGLDAILAPIRAHQLYALDVAIFYVVLWVLLRWFRTPSHQLRTTRLRGPPSESFIYGVSKRILTVEDSGAVYESWAHEYGPVYAVPSILGSKTIVLCDPQAMAHFYSKETWTYIHTPFARTSLKIFFGRGLLWAHGDDHKRQRRSLTPGFSIPAIRQLTSIFYDSVYKAKGAWDILIEESNGDSVLIDVQDWMNHISLDVIGIAGFSHNFGALEGKQACVAEILNALSTSSSSSEVADTLRTLLGQVLPLFAWLPTPQMRRLWRFTAAAREISDVLLARTQKELEMNIGADKGEKSIIGLLIKGASDNSEFHLTKEEVIAQMKTLILAGYETTSISLTWALLELSRNPDIQTELRNELLEHGTDPTYDQLTNSLPFLDAVVHEILRVHPPVTNITRVAGADDIIPLSQPVRTEEGALVDSVTITKGTLVHISMESINRSAAIWGEDAKVFRPSRWLENVHGRNGIPAKAKDVQGHRHLLTFSDGPRICLGKTFAVTEFKVVLTILVKNFVFELRDGVDTKIEIGKGVFLRPRIAGEVGCKLPLRVRPYVA